MRYHQTDLGENTTEYYIISSDTDEDTQDRTEAPGRPAAGGVSS